MQTRTRILIRNGVAITGSIGYLLALTFAAQPSSRVPPADVRVQTMPPQSVTAFQHGDIDRRGITRRSAIMLQGQSDRLDHRRVHNGSPLLPGKQQTNRAQAPKSSRLTLALVHYNPWHSIFSGEPILALYDDGTVIYFKESGTNGEYMVAKLTDELMVRLLERVSVQQVESLAGRYDSSRGVSDRSENLIVRQRPDGTYKQIIVSGSLKSVRLRGGGTRQSLPRTLVEMVDYLSSYDVGGGAAWIPDYVEVIIWPYAHFTEEDRIWPTGWPDLSDSKTVKKGDKYSLFLEKSKYPELRNLISGLKDGQGLRISNRSWAVTIRLPFPQEQVWSDILQRDEKKK